MTAASAAASPVAVEIRGLRLASRAGELVSGIDVTVPSGAAVGLVGESGSGKSLTLKAVLGVLPSGVRITGGSAGATGRVGIIPQDPLSALDPLMTVGRSVAEISRFVRGRSRADARKRVLELFEQVGLSDPLARFDAYPHQLSGGQRQRVLIAMALTADPQVLLCDEPTTALDVTIQAQVLDLIDGLRRDLGLTVVFVSHDLAVVSRMCERILVMRNGRIVEDAPTAQLLTAPQHPYTAMLLDAVLEVPELAPLPGDGSLG